MTRDRRGLIHRCKFKPANGIRFIADQNSVRRLVLDHLRSLPDGEVVTAWQVARAIDALGSTVSSRMFKMLKAGEIVEVLPSPSKHHGRIFMKQRENQW